MSKEAEKQPHAEEQKKRSEVEEFLDFCFPTGQHDFGTDSEGRWTDETRSFWNDPTIENYVALRRANPDAEIAIHIHGGLDQMYANQAELEKYGIDPNKYVSVLDANEEAISYYALFFMEKIIEARKLKEAGETHLVRRGLAVPDKLIDWFITSALDAMSHYDILEINRDLIVLIRERLGGPVSEYETVNSVEQKRLSAAWIAGALLAQGHTPTFRTIATLMHVAPTTVMRWFEGRDFAAEAEMWSHHFDANGDIRPLSESMPASPNKQPLRANERAQRESD